ncbi:GNAT family N-acetyltransferase [Streptomyces sp. NRRL F-5053]|uniref:GNAT family N-acetyltransferase n=1 Tax=Streptomyces sp. NRRL F-5053 TaxID=1463854 RepID=UPI00099B4B96|nr:GNAT family N-acetyltransferase [Streptomyces sp. NRRL F-5053]
MKIRAGQDGEFAALQEIERAAGQCFRDVGMAAIADDEPPGDRMLRGYARAGGLWVVDDEEDAGDRTGPVAYALTEPVDGCLHIEQISVHPSRSRRGIGRRLLDHLDRRAAADGLPALTLTTFADVPWNGPYYRRLGFRELPEETLPPGLRRIRRSEQEHGLDRWPRVCMRRETGGRAPSRQRGEREGGAGQERARLLPAE